jgi:CRP-like cAMP-binding protein
MTINTPSRTNSIISRSHPRFGDSADEVTFRAGETILRANQTTSHVYFPETLVATFVRRILDGNTIASGIVGFEGAIGIEAMFGATAQPSDVIVPVGGTAVSVPVSTASLVFESDREFRRFVLRFAYAFTLQIGQTAACNWFHRLDRRLALLLLRVADRTTWAGNSGKIEISLTQEFLASMLGTRIATVNESISALTAAGLIRHRRHLIEIVDRTGLEGTACECYATVRSFYERNKVM